MADEGPTILVNKRLLNGCRQAESLTTIRWAFTCPPYPFNKLELLSYRMIVDISIMSMCMAALLIMSVLLN